MSVLGLFLSLIIRTSCLAHKGSQLAFVYWQHKRINIWYNACMVRKQFLWFSDYGRHSFVANQATISNFFLTNFQLVLGTGDILSYCKRRGNLMYGSGKIFCSALGTEILHFSCSLPWVYSDGWTAVTFLWQKGVKKKAVMLVLTSLNWRSKTKHDLLLNILLWKKNPHWCKSLQLDFLCSCS